MSWDTLFGAGIVLFVWIFFGEQISGILEAIKEERAFKKQEKKLERWDKFSSDVRLVVDPLISEEKKALKASGDLIRLDLCNVEEVLRIEYNKRLRDLESDLRDDFGKMLENVRIAREAEIRRVEGVIQQRFKAVIDRLDDGQRANREARNAIRNNLREAVDTLEGMIKELAQASIQDIKVVGEDLRKLEISLVGKDLDAEGTLELWRCFNGNNEYGEGLIGEIRAAIENVEECYRKIRRKDLIVPNLEENRETNHQEGS